MCGTEMLSMQFKEDNISYTLQSMLRILGNASISKQIPLQNEATMGKCRKTESVSVIISLCCAYWLAAMTAVQWNTDAVAAVSHLCFPCLPLDRSALSPFDCLRININESILPATTWRTMNTVVVRKYHEEQLHRLCAPLIPFLTAHQTQCLQVMI